MRSVVMVLEDDLKMSALIKETIEKNFQEVTIYVANSTAEGHEIVKNVKIDILISDINLEDPSYTGVDFVKDILEGQPNLTVIFQSDIDDKDFRLQLHEDVEYLSYIPKIDSQYAKKLIAKVGRAIDIVSEVEDRVVVFPSKYSTLCVDSKDLLYVTTTERTKVLRVGYLDKSSRKPQKTEVYGMTLKSVLELVGENNKLLFKIQQSVLINPRMINRVDHTAEEVFLDYGDLNFPVGREYKKIVRNVLKSLMDEEWE